MTDNADIAELIRDYNSRSGKRGRPYAYSPEVARQRAFEQNRRTSRAHVIGIAILKRLHPDEWREIYTAALKQVNAERGPLPGDNSEGTE